MSTGGIFIETKMPSSVGQEIAFQFSLPKARQTVKAAGVIVRKTYSGIGVHININFRV
jgi:Tfp pilus assembly protein PilZ